MGQESDDLMRDDPYQTYADERSGARLGSTMGDEELATEPAVKGRLKGDPSLSSADGSDPEMTRAEIERTRMEMSGTIDAISERLDPQVVAQKARDSVREAAMEKAAETRDAVKGATIGRVQDAVSSAGESLGGMAQRVQDAVAPTANTAGQAARNTGAAVGGTGRSLWMTIRTHPMPSAMAGIGLCWLIISMRKEHADSSPMNYRQANAMQPMPYGEPANLAAQRGQYGGQTASMMGGMQEPQDTGPGQRLGAMSDMARDKLSSASDTAGQWADQTRQGTSQLMDRTRQEVGQFGTQMQTNAQQAGSNFQRMVYDNPLVAGAIFVGLGAMAGLAIPETDKENQLMGQTHDALMEQAGQAAQDAVGRARDAALDAIP